MTRRRGDVYRKEVASPDAVLFSTWILDVTTRVPVSPRPRVSVSVSPSPCPRVRHSLHPSSFRLHPLLDPLISDLSLNLDRHTSYVLPTGGAHCLLDFLCDRLCLIRINFNHDFVVNDVDDLR